MTKPFTKPEVDEILGRLRELLRSAGEELEFVFGRATYTDVDFQFKVTAKRPGGVTRKDVRAKEDLRMFAKLDNLPVDRLDEEILVNGVLKCKLVGYNTRSPKYPYVVQVEDGRKLRVTAEGIRLAFNPNPKEV